MQGKESRAVWEEAEFYMRLEEGYCREGPAVYQEEALA